MKISMKQLLLLILFIGIIPFILFITLILVHNSVDSKCDESQNPEYRFHDARITCLIDKFSGLAISYGTPLFCLDPLMDLPNAQAPYNSYPAKNDCLAKYILATETPIGCNWYTADRYCQKANNELAINIENIELCNYAGEFQGRCISDIAKKKEKPPLCENINKKELHTLSNFRGPTTYLHTYTECLKQFPSFTYSDAIKSVKSIDVCGYGPFYNGRYECYALVGELLQDIEICNQANQYTDSVIKYCELGILKSTNFDDYREKCKEFLVQTGSLSGCDDVVLENPKKYCELITTDYERSQCYMFSAFYLDEVDYCDLLPELLIGRQNKLRTCKENDYISYTYPLVK